MDNQKWQELLATVEQAKGDAEDFFGEKANASAGRRFRGHCKTIADLCKELRKDVSTIKAERQASKG